MLVYWEPASLWWIMPVRSADALRRTQIAISNASNGRSVRMLVAAFQPTLGDPCAGGVGGDPGQVDSSPVYFHEEQDVRAPQGDGLHAEEVTCQRPGGLSTQELQPGRAATPWSRAEAVGAQNGAD
jgi:hypothetical protein